MLIIDSRETDGILEEIRKFDVPTAVMKLESADYRFTGLGPDKTEVLVGIERKKLDDLINSMRDRRLSGRQLRLMQQEHDYVFLVVEGVWRPGAAGEIEVPRGKVWGPYYSRPGGGNGRSAVSYRQLLAYLTTLELKGNIIYRRTFSRFETALMLVGLWHWFNDKEWEQHHSDDQVYCGDLPAKGHGGGWAQEHSHASNEEFQLGRRGRVMSVGKSQEPTSLLRMAMQLPGIDRRAEAVAREFKTVRNMDLAGLEPGIREQVDRWFRENPKAQVGRWQEIDGIGPAISRAAVRAIEEEGA